MSEKKNRLFIGILIGVIIIFIIIVIIFLVSNASNTNQDFQKLLCAKDFGDSARYRTENIYGLILGDTQKCAEDCANYCPQLNMKYSKSNLIDNSNCEPCDEGARQREMCNDCICYCK